MTCKDVMILCIQSQTSLDRTLGTRIILVLAIRSSSDQDTYVYSTTANKMEKTALDAFIATVSRDRRCTTESCGTWYEAIFFAQSNFASCDCVRGFYSKAVEVSCSIIS